ncbi:hypothetical protein T11_8125 [Trichinella zimbabwensis]|uniref:Uncharacterized protein n=1 Tax=Trichinella zimbabwensis TaxID=268475 RepID=A0A0V1GSA2_9BILA|nr:hypothetical protein T11_8125 [Trichinella zimbabwensis]
MIAKSLALSSFSGVLKPMSIWGRRKIQRTNKRKRSSRKRRLPAKAQLSVMPHIVNPITYRRTEIVSAAPVCAEVDYS